VEDGLVEDGEVGGDERHPALFDLETGEVNDGSEDIEWCLEQMR
jgi:hypothetical protein